MRIILLVLFSYLTVTTFADSMDQRWKQSVEEILSGVMLGPLSATFEPASLAKREKKTALMGQINRLRAHIVGSMFRSIRGYVKVCPLEDSTSEAIETLGQEFRARKFDMHWIPSRCECPNHDGFIYATIPLPSKEEEAKE